MKKINFVFGLHNHQPVGNFDSVFADAYDLAYKPFLDVLDRHPKIRVVVHNTGILWEWLAKHRPEYLVRIRGFVKSGQMELMTGGFYEPILSVIPDADKVGQIRKLTEFVKQNTGYEATGMWLAERVWEPGLVTPMAQAGVKYTVLDDSHFRSTGIPEKDTHGYFYTEDLGATVAAFPISEKLRYTIPFLEPEETINYLRSVATADGQATVVMADDGEKFGVWPNTHEHCYKKGWLERFFTALEQNFDWINMTTFADVVKATKPLGRTYLPTASYFEMMEWTMPPSAILQYEDFVHELQREGKYDANKVFVRAGFWRNFFTKYAESNQIHKRMISVSRRLEKLSAQATPEQRHAAQDGLWASQCNCGYWHGVFGGLYLGHLRNGLYKSMIDADKVLDQVEFGGKSFVRVSKSDFLADMNDAVVLESSRQTVIVKPDQGGQIIEHDWKPRSINLTDALTRRFEAYHKKVSLAAAPGDDMSHNEGKSIHDIILAKERNLEQYLTYDWYRRSSLVDHFLGDNADLQSFRTARFAEDGDFVNQPYGAVTEQKGDSVRVTLVRNGNVYRTSGALAVQVAKTISLKKDSDVLEVYYTVTNQSGSQLKTRFGVETVVNLLAGDAHDRYYLGVDSAIENPRLNNPGTQSGVSEFGAADEWMDLKFAVSVSKPADVWRAPIETVSLSESGFERVYQGSALMPVWRLDLAPGGVFEVVLKVQLSGVRQPVAV